jgi:small subunit ribosomal protein S6
VILPFETEYRRDERIIRFLTTKMDKHHVAYAESRRNKSKQTDKAVMDPNNA